MKKLLYNFLWIHSVIMWMYTFFLPLLLLKMNFSLSEISLFISITWLSYFIFLYIWDILRIKFWLKLLIYLSFLLESLLIISWFALNDSILLLSITAFLYWWFNCFYWVTQRVLFISNIDKTNAWNSYWNVQIVSFLLIKLWVLIGSLLLENNSFVILLLSAVIINLSWIFYFSRMKIDKKFLDNFKEHKLLTFKEVIRFKDDLKSKFIFILDGPFLYLESFFWIITLFFITDENYRNLWLLVITLTFSFSLFFILLKKNVDKINPKKILYIWVGLYSLSWLLRWFITTIKDEYLSYLLVLIIIFFTAFFRLIFNKQFFQTSKNTDTHKYLLIKSYYSQFSLFLFFWILSIVFYFFEWNILFNLNIIYFIAFIFSILFIFYLPS